MDTYYYNKRRTDIKKKQGMGEDKREEGKEITMKKKAKANKR